MNDLVVRDITRDFPTPAEPLRILKGVSFELKAGQNVAIVGPSGSGKSTLLQILGTLDRPTSGSVQLDGNNPFDLNEAALADFRNQQVGFVFQDHYLLPQLTALENVLVPALAQGRPDDGTTSRAKALLDQVGLTDRMTHRPAELSGGERQRVAIARALVQQPVLLLADEPTGNLDQTNARAVGDLLLQLQKQRDPPMIMVVVTHSIELAERLDQKMLLDDGRLTES